MSKRVLALLGVYVCECACVEAVCCVLCGLMHVDPLERLSEGRRRRASNEEEFVWRGWCGACRVRGMAAHTAY